MIFKLVRKVMMSRPGCVAGGAGLMYLLDPDRGHSRRAQLIARAEGAARREVQDALRSGHRQAKHMVGQLKGEVAKKAGLGSYRPSSDVDLREHIRQVVRSLPQPTGDINVDVVDGAVSLRGQVDSPEQHEHVNHAVTSVPGVAVLQDYLHLPGEDAPNKAAVLRLSS